MSKNDLENLLDARAAIHGDYRHVAGTSQRIKHVIRTSYQTRPLSPRHIEALEMIAVKMARIISGDPNFDDHWDDIAGYAMLGKAAKK